MRWSLFGPVLPYDLVRTTRRGRTFFLRAVYLAWLLFFLYGLYEASTSGMDGQSLFHSRSLDRTAAARFAEQFFAVVMATQFVAVFLITPIFTAGLITEEKEQRTLELVLTTDLRDREIVLGKLFSRLAQLALLVLAGLPVLSFLPFLGGVEPLLVLYGYLATAVTMVSLASLGVLMSLRRRTSFEAIVLTYGYTLGFLLLTSLCMVVPVPLFNFGNPITALVQMQYAMASGPSSSPGDPGEIIWEAVLGYTCWHLLFASVVFTVVVVSFRKSALAAVTTPAQRPRIAAGQVWERKSPRYRPHFPVGDDALWWKETRPGRSREPSDVLRESPWGFFGLSLLTWALLILLPRLLAPDPTIGSESEETSTVFRTIGTILAAVVLLGAALNAAVRFTVEFEKKTLDSLLTIPERSAILDCKALASLWSMRWLWYLLSAWWAISVGVRALSWTGFLLLVLASLLFGILAVSLGLCFSMYTRSTVRASAMTLFTAVFLPLGVHQVVEQAGDTAFVEALISPELLTSVQDHAVTPVAILATLTVPPGDRSDDALFQVDTALFGALAYALLAGGLWLLAKRCFRGLTRQGPTRRLPT
jgi:ABC-type transport system involved in multi-copper enzyme maturation permease subunit